MDSTFKIDLELSHQKERALEYKFQLQSLCTSNTQTLKNFPGYDIETWVSGSTTGTTKYEVKYDYLSATTGRVAVEAYKLDNKGKKVKSGITATSADYYVYCFPNDDNFYSIKVADLGNILKNQDFLKVVNGGDGGRYRLCLFDKSHFLSMCSII